MVCLMGGSVLLIIAFGSWTQSVLTHPVLALACCLIHDGILYHPPLTVKPMFAVGNSAQKGNQFFL